MWRKVVQVLNDPNPFNESWVDDRALDDIRVIRIDKNIWEVLIDTPELFIATEHGRRFWIYQKEN